MMKTNPCKDCDARHFACHADCEAYTEWAKRRREETIQTSKDKAALDMMYDYGGKWRRCRYHRRKKR